MALLIPAAVPRNGERPPAPRRAWPLVLAVLAGMLLLAAGADTREHRVKAVFLFNFALFVDWPATAFATTNSPLVIGVLGQDPFGGVLDEAVRGEKVKDRALEVRRFRDVGEIDRCHILFISTSEEPRLEPILSRLKGRHILTVGDAARFAGRGGMVRFANEGGKIRLRINLEAAKADGLTISSKLLRPARIVTTERE